MSSAQSLQSLLDQTSWIHALARRLVADPNLAADLAQETCAEALVRAPSADRPLRGWLATVMRRNLARLRRGESSRAEREHGAARAERESSALDVLERAETHKNVVLAVLALPEPYRGALLLRFFEQLSYLEIARRTGVTRAAVNSRITRGLELLRQRLESRYGGDRRALLLVLTPLAKLPTGLAVPFLGVNAMNLTIGLAAATLLATSVSLGLSREPRGGADPHVPASAPVPPASELGLVAPPFAAVDTGRTAAPAPQEERHRKVRDAEEEVWKTELQHGMAVPETVRALAVSARSGDVEVRPSPSGRLEIEAKVRARLAEVPAAELTQVLEDHVDIREEGGVLKVEDAHREARGWSVSFVVHVPRRLAVVANTGSGDIRILSAHDKVTANTGSGDVRVDLAAEPVRSLAMNTGSGDVVAQVSSVEGELAANTGSGDVTVLVVDPSSPGEVALSAGSGNVALVVPASVVGSFDLATSAGDVEVPPALGLVVERDHAGQKVRGTLGNGRGSYRARTGAGGVRVELGSALPTGR